jgi:hypothetical protein
MTPAIPDKPPFNMTQEEWTDFVLSEVAAEESQFFGELEAIAEARDETQ